MADVFDEAAEEKEEKPRKDKFDPADCCENSYRKEIGFTDGKESSPSVAQSKLFSPLPPSLSQPRVGAPITSTRKIAKKVGQTLHSASNKLKNFRRGQKIAFIRKMGLMPKGGFTSDAQIDLQFSKALARQEQMRRQTRQAQRIREASSKSTIEDFFGVSAEFKPRKQRGFDPFKI